MAEPGAGERRKLRTLPVWAAAGVLLALGFWLLGQRWTHTGQAPPFAPAQMPNTAYGTPDNRYQAGQRLEITARVEEAAPSRAFWIGPGQGKRLLVLPLERDTPMDAVRAGEMVAIVGRLEKPASPDVIVREWNLDPRTAAILAREPVYLRAESIRPAASK